MFEGKPSQRPMACGLRAESSAFSGDATVRTNFYVATQYGCAVLLNKDTFEPNFLCVQLLVLCKLRYATWVVEGMVVVGKFRRAPDKSCPHFTIANIRINNECAKRRSVSIALLLLIRDLCLKVGVVLTGDFNNCALRKLPLGCSESQRRISLVEAASGSVRVLRRTLGVTPLWRPGAVLHGHQWPECCGFVVLPGSQNEWLIMKHGSFDIKPAEVGFRSTDQTCNYDQWLHLKNARPKRRRDGRLKLPTSQLIDTFASPSPPHPFLPSHLVQPALHLWGGGGGGGRTSQSSLFFVTVCDPSICPGFPSCCRPSVRAPGVRPSSCFCSVVNR